MLVRAEVRIELRGPEAGITGGCELSGMGAVGNRTQGLRKPRGRLLNHRYISPVPNSFSLSVCYNLESIKILSGGIA